jgi:hypothetical protein
MVKPSPRGPAATGGDGYEAPVLAEGKGGAWIVSKSRGAVRIYSVCSRRWVSRWKRMMSKRAPGRRFVVNTMRLSAPPLRRQHAGQLAPHPDVRPALPWRVGSWSHCQPDQRPCRRQCALRGEQGSAGPHHARRRAGVRPPRNHRERHQPGRHRYRLDEQGADGRGRPSRPAGPCQPARGLCQPRQLSVLGAGRPVNHQAGRGPPSLRRGWPWPARWLPAPPGWPAGSSSR